MPYNMFERSMVGYRLEQLSDFVGCVVRDTKLKLVDQTEMTLLLTAYTIERWRISGARGCETKAKTPLCQYRMP